jgi:hypothetical protein
MGAHLRLRDDPLLEPHTEVTGLKKRVTSMIRAFYAHLITGKTTMRRSHGKSSSAGIAST